MMKRCLIVMTAAALALIATGCATGGGGVAVSTKAVDAVGLTGRARGGQSAITGGTVKLWKVNTDGTAATQMLSTTTDSNGFFNLNSSSNCSSTVNPTTQVYITITGGNPGLSGNNPALALMAALGPCSGLAAIPFVDVDEVTTVASVWALQQFIGVTDGVAGSDDIAVNTMTQSVTGMINAFATVPVLTTLSQGAAVSSYSNATIESAKIDTIANILSTCVNSDGTGNCATLFAAVTPSGDTAPADTIQAALYMATNPANNIAQIFGYQTGVGAPFAPNLSAAPFDWTLAVSYTGSGLNIPLLLAPDANGNIWITDSPGSPNNALVELGPNGQVVSGSPFLSGSGSPLSGPQTVALDTLGNVWVANHGSSVNDLFSFPGSGSTVTKHNAPTSPSACQPESMAIDGSNNAFFTCSGITDLFEFANGGGTGVPSYSSSATQYGAVGSTPEGMAIDPGGNVWVSNNGSNTVTEFAAGSYSTAANTFSVGSSAFGIAVDHAGDAWEVDGSGLNEFVKSGSTYNTNNFSGGGLNNPRYLAIDGSGDVWIANSADTTVSGTDYVTVSEFTNNGTAITADSNTDIPGGFAHATTAGSPSLRGIAVDPSGNVWVTGCGSSSSCTSASFVMEIVGAATPVVTPLSAAIGGNQLGCCSFTPASPGGTVPTSPGYITLQASSYSPVQLGGSFSFLVTRVGGSNGAVSVHYATSDGTGSAGTDYTATSGTLSWTSGDTSIRTITVPWLRTSTYTGTKTFNVTLSSATGGAAITPNANTLVTVTGNLTPPSTHFTLTPWYLALPVDIYGGNGGTNSIQFAAASITTLSSAAFSDPYYYLNASNQIVFTAPSNGAVTSPGSGTDDARSELRELYTGTGHDSNSDWYGNTDGSVGGTMTGTCVVESVSADTDEGTFAQIHGQVEPFVLLIYRPGHTDVEIQIENTSAATGDVRTELAANVSLGDTISYSLSYSAPSLTAAGSITVHVNDVTTGTTNSAQVLPVDSSWSSQGQYFKIGAYSGANHIGNPTGDQTQVLYSAWSITH